MRLLSIALWSATVGALVGTVHALAVDDGRTAWDLAKVAVFIVIAAVLLDLLRKLVSRWS